MGWGGSGHPVGVEELREVRCGIFLIRAGKLGKSKGLLKYLLFFWFIFPLLNCHKCVISVELGFLPHEKGIHKTKTLNSHPRQTHKLYYKSLEFPKNFNSLNPINLYSSTSFLKTKTKTET